MPVPEEREEQRRPEDDIEYGLDASDTTIRWRNGVFEHKRGRLDTWVLQWHKPTPTFPGAKQDPELQSGGTLRVSRFWIYQNNGTETYISFAEGTFLTHEKAQFLVDYSTWKIPTFGVSNASWQELCEEINHNGGIGYAVNASNFQLDGSIESAGSKYAVWIAALLFPPIYGGVHLTPWKAHFPTYLEQYLWRASGLCIACGVPTVASLFQLSVYSRKWDRGDLNPFNAPVRAFNRVMSSYPKDGGFCDILFYPFLVLIALDAAVFMIGLGFMVLLYPAARLYIVVEAFASLRSLPVGAYDTVVWAEMLPHLT